MLTRIRLAWRVLRGAHEPTAAPVPREQYDEMRAFYQQHVHDLRKAFEETRTALIEERSPGTLARLAPRPKREPVPEPEREPEAPLL